MPSLAATLRVGTKKRSQRFFASAEAQHLDAGVSITPIRQEQLKNRLGDRFHELDVPLLVEWPDGRRDAQLFVLEEETDPSRLSIHRLAHYCLELAGMYGTNRVVTGTEKQLKHIDFIDIYTAMDDNQMHEYQTRQRLQQATAKELECWADNILDAKTLDEVFVCH